MEAKGGKVLPLGILAKDIRDKDVILTAKIQGVDDGAADESGPASDKNGCGHGSDFGFGR
jgi:hypothetical protein